MITSYKRRALLLLLVVITIFTAVFIPLAAVQNNAEARVYAGSGGGICWVGRSNREYVHYTRRVDNAVSIDDKGFPVLRTSTTRGCGPIAGGGILAFYSQWFPNLVPGHQIVAVTADGRRRFTGQTAALNQAIDQLSRDMGAVNNGVTIAGFQSGLATYVNRAGLRIQYHNTMHTNRFLGIPISRSFCFATYQQQIRAGRPVLIAVDRWHATIIASMAGRLQITSMYPRDTRGHALVGNGYRIIHYYRNETVSVADPVWFNPFRRRQEIREVRFRTDKFIIAAEGLGGITYVNINGHFRATDAFGVWIGR